ncbi:hypothetical protein [Spirosoma aerolatum]|nr:hypothetical protein [Spirosoma aerolatum]
MSHGTRPTSQKNLTVETYALSTDGQRYVVFQLVASPNDPEG